MSSYVRNFKFQWISLSLKVTSVPSTPVLFHIPLSECRKIRTRINPNTDTFYAVSSTINFDNETLSINGWIVHDHMFLIFLQGFTHLDQSFAKLSPLSYVVFNWITLQFLGDKNEDGDYMISLFRDEISTCPAGTDFTLHYLRKSDFIPARRDSFPPGICVALFTFL